MIFKNKKTGGLVYQLSATNSHSTTPFTGGEYGNVSCGEKDDWEIIKEEEINDKK